jgi:MinD superfamily P-loop ATPase
MSSIPITVFTGFLGAGKTSVILSLLPKLPNDYKVVLLKVGPSALDRPLPLTAEDAQNEFGDVAVDRSVDGYTFTCLG